MKKKNVWTVGYVPIDCAGCGQRFGVQDSFNDAVILKGKEFYCPGGCSLINTKAYAEKKEKERVEQEMKEKKEMFENEKLLTEKMLEPTLWQKIKIVLGHRLFGS